MVAISKDPTGGKGRIPGEMDDMRWSRKERHGGGLLLEIFDDICAEVLGKCSHRMIGLKIGDVSKK